MKRQWPPFALAAVLIGAAVYAYGSDGGTFQAQLIRHVLATILQIAAPLLAGLGCVAAMRAYAPGDRERAVWTFGALASLAWTAGRVLFAGYQWFGGTALPYPSLADGFFVAFYVLIALALALEIRLVLPMVDRGVRMVLLGLGIAGWVAGFVSILAPIVISTATPVEKALAAFYPTVAVFLVPAGLMPAFGFRGGISAYPWLAVAVAALCLAGASLGYVFLTWYNLYSDVHSVNALWVAGFVFLALGGFWQRTAQEEV
ncbi:MAG: hypothetical protein QN178_12200 [Armatimonadota bacterium]|nr:hypothetical protein [Armatimonadota bacterium]